MTSTVLNRILRPTRSGHAWERSIALGALFTPLCVVALALSADQGRLGTAITLTALCAGAVVAIVAIVVGTRIDLVPNGLRSRRFDGVRTITADQVARVAIRRIRNSDEVTSQRNLFLIDANGVGLLRLSDRYWTDAQIEEIAHHFTAPVESVDEPVGLAELRRVSPEQLRWRERNPLLSTASFALVIFAAGLGLAWFSTAAT